jgi:hypothetical protein
MMAKPTKARIKQVAIRAMQAEFPEARIRDGSEGFAIYFEKGKPEEFGFVMRVMTLAAVRRVMRARRLKQKKAEPETDAT